MIPFPVGYKMCRKQGYLWNTVGAWRRYSEAREAVDFADCEVDPWLDYLRDHPHAVNEMISLEGHGDPYPGPEMFEPHAAWRRHQSERSKASKPRVPRTYTMQVRTPQGVIEMEYEV